MEPEEGQQSEEQPEPEETEEQKPVETEEEQAQKQQGAEDEGPPKLTGKARRIERARVHKEIVQRDERIRALEDQIAQLAETSRRSVEASTRVADNLERATKPQEEPFRERVQKRILRALSRIDDKGENVGEYADEMAALVEEAADERARAIVRHEIAEAERTRQRSGPAQDVLPYLGMAPWLAEPEMYGELYREVKRLRDIERLNLRDPGTMDKTVRRAIYEVGKRWNREVVGATNGARAGAVRGTGSSSGGSGGDEDNEAPALPEHLKRYADVNPQFAKLPPQKRYAAAAKYYAGIARGERG